MSLACQWQGEFCLCVSVSDTSSVTQARPAGARPAGVAKLSLLFIFVFVFFSAFDLAVLVRALVTGFHCADSRTLMCSTYYGAETENGGELEIDCTYLMCLHRWRFPGVGEFQCYDKYVSGMCTICLCLRVCLVSTKRRQPRQQQRHRCMQHSSPLLTLPGPHGRTYHPACITATHTKAYSIKAYFELCRSHAPCPHAPMQMLQSLKSAAEAAGHPEWCASGLCLWLGYIGRQQLPCSRLRVRPSILIV